MGVVAGDGWEVALFDGGDRKRAGISYSRRFYEGHAAGNDFTEFVCDMALLVWPLRSLEKSLSGGCP